MVRGCNGGRKFTCGCVCEGDPHPDECSVFRGNRRRSFGNVSNIMDAVRLCREIIIMEAVRQNCGWVN